MTTFFYTYTMNTDIYICTHETCTNEVDCVGQRCLAHTFACPNETCIREVDEAGQYCDVHVLRIRTPSPNPEDDWAYCEECEQHYELAEDEVDTGVCYACDIKTPEKSLAYCEFCECNYVLKNGDDELVMCYECRDEWTD